MLLDIGTGFMTRGYREVRTWFLPVAERQYLSTGVSGMDMTAVRAVASQRQIPNFGAINVQKISVEMMTSYHDYMSSVGRC